MKISVVGTGYVGLVTGISLAEIGHEVICIDIDEKKIKMLNQFKSPIYEPGLEELIKSNFEKNRISFKLNKEVDYEDSEVIYLAVGTPQAKDGTANLTYIYQVVEEIKEKCHKDKIIVTKSTVPVGTNAKIKERLNSNSKNHFDVVSNPEFLREGSAIEDVFNAERIVIGSDSEDALNTIDLINKKFEAPVIRTNFESAEITKYASNAFLATKISYVNMISNLCESVGADIYSVTKGMGLDKRIGEKFLNAGIGYGGSCFPKDTSALTKIADSFNVDSSIVKATIETNAKQKIKLIEYLDEIYSDLSGRKISLLGASFKPETDDIREAPSIVIIEELIKRNAEVYVYDPQALRNLEKIFGKKIKYTVSIEELILDSEALMVVTEWKIFKNINLEILKLKMKRPLILDGRGVLLDATDDENIEYRVIGRRGIN